MACVAGTLLTDLFECLLASTGEDYFLDLSMSFSIILGNLGALMEARSDQNALTSSWR